jgi:serine/threonine protein kinase
MRKLKSENLLRLQEVHETVNSIYLVVDYYKGGTLLSTLYSKFDIQ